MVKNVTNIGMVMNLALLGYKSINIVLEIQTLDK